MEFGSSSQLSKKRNGNFSPENTMEKRFRNPYIGARPRNGKWEAEIRVPKTEKRIWLKYHDTAEAAARAYDFASYHLYGPNGPCNFPNDRSLQGVSQLIDSKLAAYILQSIAQYTSVGTHKVPGTKSPTKLSTTCHSIDDPIVKDQLDHGPAHKVNPEPTVTSNVSEVEPYVPELDFINNGFEMEQYFPSFAPEQPLTWENLPFDEAFIKGSDDWILDFMADTPTNND